MYQYFLSSRGSPDLNCKVKVLGVPATCGMLENLLDSKGRNQLEGPTLLVVHSLAAKKQL